MRPGIIIAIVVAGIVVIGGVVWYNNQTEQARLQDEQAAQVEREEAEELAREEVAAATEQAARDVEDAETSTAEVAGVEEDNTLGAEDGATVVGDEITGDTIVVDSASDEPTILAPDDTTTTATNVDDVQSSEAASLPDTEVQAAGGDGDTSGAGEADSTAETATATEPEQLLTPANFDHDEVLALIDGSEQMTADRRSTLRALVEGASANPEMVDAAIESIRAALELPPLN